MKVAGVSISKATIEELFDFFEFEAEDKVLKGIDQLKHAEDKELARPSPMKKRKSEANMSHFRQVHSRSLRNIAFSVAARKWDIGGSSRILEKFRDVNIPLDLVDCHGQTPLFYAAREHDIASIRLLVGSGCDVARLDALHNQTCIYYAVREPPVAPKVRQQVFRNFCNRRLKAVELLLSLGCPVDTYDNNGCSVVEFCSDMQLKRCLASNSNPDPTWIHQFQREEDKYGVRVVQPQHIEEVAALETEFIRDHEAILERVMGEKPPMKATCASIGLKVNSTERKAIIIAIMGQSKKLAKTLVAIDQGNGEVCGYLYLKCEQSKGIKSVEISHLKVKNSRQRRGIARELFQGVMEYLKLYRLDAYAQHMELSVFAENRSAIGLYRSLGFTEDREWNSVMKNWPRRDPTPFVAWRRYSRKSSVKGNSSPSSVSTRCTTQSLSISSSKACNPNPIPNPMRQSSKASSPRPRRESIADAFPTPRVSALKRHAAKECDVNDGRLHMDVSSKRLHMDVPATPRRSAPYRADVLPPSRCAQWDPSPQSNAGVLKRTRSAILETPRCDKRRRSFA